MNSTTGKQLESVSMSSSSDSGLLALPRLHSYPLTSEWDWPIGPLPKRRKLRWLRETLRRDTLLQNSLILMMTTVSNAVTGYVFWAIAARRLSANSIGVATSLVGAAQLVALVGTLGLGSWFVSTIGRMNTPQWSNAVTCSISVAASATGLLGVIGIVALPRFSHRFASLETPFHAGGFVVACVVLAMANLTDDALIAEQAPRFHFGRNALFGFSKLCVLGLLIHMGIRGELPILVAWTVGGAFALVVAWKAWIPAVRSTFRPNLRGSVRLSTLLQQSGQHQMIDVAGRLPLYLLPAVVLVRATGPDAATLSLTWMIASIFFLVSPAVSNALIAKGGLGSLSDSLRRSAVTVGLLLGVGVPIVCTFPETFLHLFGGSVAAKGSKLLVVLAVSSFPDAVTNLWIAKRRIQKELSAPIAVNWLMAAIVLAGSWLFVPRYGIVSAGFAWLAAQTVGALFVAFDSFAEHRARRLAVTERNR